MSDAPSPEPRVPTEDLEDLYEHAPCGYLSFTQDGRICKVNTTLATWLGFERDELVGRRFSTLLKLAGRIYFETHFAPLLRMQGFFNEVALDLVTRGGEAMATLVNAAERRDEDGRVTFTRVTVFRATDRRRYERELLEARAAANDARAVLDRLNAELAGKLELSRASEASVRAILDSERSTAELREQFIAVVGHDLRSPLAALINSVALLEMQSLHPQTRGVLDLMRRSTRRMAELIDNILDFARGRLGGGIVLDSRPEQLQDTLEHVVQEIRAGAPTHAIDVAMSLDVPVVCDRIRIAQLASNLLANAVTHGAANVPIRFEAVTLDGRFELAVINGGEPIGELAMEHLFHPFFRAQARASRQGLGLGLYIASEIAKAHGGSLVASSTAAETRFTFSMPVQPPVPADRETTLGAAASLTQVDTVTYSGAPGDRP